MRHSKVVFGRLSCSVLGPMVAESEAVYAQLINAAINNELNYLCMQQHVT